MPKVLKIKKMQLGNYMSYADGTQMNSIIGMNSLNAIKPLKPFKFNLNSKDPLMNMAINPTSSAPTGGQGFDWKSLGSNVSSIGNNPLVGQLGGIFGAAAASKTSATTGAINQGYDAIANAASSIPGVGTIVGGAMKLGGLASDALTSMGVGTDQMTGVDKVLDSKFLKLTPLGLVNAIGAKKSTAFKTDIDVAKSSGYMGALAGIDDAVKSAGKKYGLFSSGAMGSANADIGSAEKKQNIIRDLLTTNKDLKSSDYANDLNRDVKNRISGGYNQANMQFGKEGMKLQKARAQKTLTIDPYERFKQSLPSNLGTETNDYDLKGLFNNAGISSFKEGITKGIFTKLEDGKWHAPSVVQEKNTNNYIFLKNPNHPTIQKELEWYNSPEGSDFKSQYDLDKTGPQWKYVPKKVEDLPIEGMQMLQKGGVIGKSVIPGGALHAHKHYIDAIDNDTITQKGIPVIEYGDEIEQHAEIERGEIILRDEITKKLEELWKNGSDEAMIKAGKLVADEIVLNTEDKSGENLLKDENNRIKD